ncbi:MAG: hypothetical protein ACQEXJ_04075 [Myxococcota bacterium]
MGPPPAEDAQASGRRAVWPLVLVTVLLLLPATAWAGAYFWLRTDAGQAQLREDLVEDLRPGSLDFRAVRWGPAPSELWFVDAVVRDRSGKPAIGARAIGGDLDLGTLLDGRLHLRRTRAVDFEVRLAWDAEGTFSLKDAFRKGPPEEEEDKPPEPEVPPPLVRFDGVRLDRGLVTLDWPVWGLRFEEVDARGRVHLGGERGLLIEADLEGALARADVDHRTRTVAFDALRIAGFRWEGEGFDTETLALTGGDGARVVLAGGMRFGDPTRMDVAGDVLLTGPETRDVLGRWLPGGAEVRGLETHLEGEALVVDASRASAPVITAGPFRLEDVSLPVKGRAAPGGLVPTVSFDTRDATIGRLQAPEGFEARDVSVARLEASMSGNAALRVVDARASGMTLPEGEVGATRADGRLEVGLSGGEVQGAVATDQGTLKAEGSVDVQLMKREARITVVMTLDDFTDTLARSLKTALPDDVASRLEEPIRGQARFRGRAAREEPAEDTGEREWGLSFYLDSGHLVGRGRVEYREDDWVPALETAGDGGP